MDSQTKQLQFAFLARTSAARVVLFGGGIYYGHNIDSGRFDTYPTGASSLPQVMKLKTSELGLIGSLGLGVALTRNLALEVDARIHFGITQCLEQTELGWKSEDLFLAVTFSYTFGQFEE